MEQRAYQQPGRHILPSGNDPEQLALSPEGRRMLKKEIVNNMSHLWRRVGKLPETEIERLGNGILEARMPRKKLVEIHKNAQNLSDGLQGKLFPQA